MSTVSLSVGIISILEWPTFWEQNPKRPPRDWAAQTKRKEFSEYLASAGFGYERKISGEERGKGIVFGLEA